MASSPTRRVFKAPDGVELAWHELGEGRPVVLLHGLFSDADTNWIRYGHAAEIAARGFRIIMPDLRGHGTSAKPHNASAYPPDILADDGLALIDHLGLADYDLGGYSLGGRTAVRMVAKGARPRRLVISGMGLQGLIETGRRSSHFKSILRGLGTHERGTPEWMAEAFKTTGGELKALLPLLDSLSTPMKRSWARSTRPPFCPAPTTTTGPPRRAKLRRTAPRRVRHQMSVTKSELSGHWGFSGALTVLSGRFITPPQPRAGHESGPSETRMPAP